MPSRERELGDRIEQLESELRQAREELERIPRLEAQLVQQRARLDWLEREPSRHDVVELLKRRDNLEPMLEDRGERREKKGRVFAVVVAGLIGFGFLRMRCGQAAAALVSRSPPCPPPTSRSAGLSRAP